MRRSFFPKAFLATFLASFLGITIWIFAEKTASLDLSFEKELFRPYPIAVKGLSASRVNGNRLLSHLKADEFKVNPRKYFIFNVRPFNEVTFSNVTLETHVYPDMGEMAGGMSLISPNEKIMSAQGAKDTFEGIGIVTRGVIKDLVWKIYKADSLCLIVKAKRGHIDFKKKKTYLKNASLENLLTQRLVLSKSVIWNETDRVFEITGEYLVVTPEGKVSGKGIKLDVEFILNPFS